MEIKRFDKKVVLITGGSSGIGRAAAELFAQAGARVVISARRADVGEEVASEICAGGGQCTFVRVDVSSPEDVDAMVAAVVQKHGRLDCAFNNAATASGIHKRLAEFDDREWEQCMASNLRGVWLCLRAEIRQMLAQSPGGGAIVNTSSVNGLGAAPRGGLYSAAKAGVLALSKSAALDYANDGIRVNALVAGAFDTPMLGGAMATAADQSGQSVAAIRAHYESRVPMSRIGDPAEAARAALWLCSDEASYVTGHSMIVDGGMTCFDR